MELTELKARAYDILAAREQLGAQLNQVNQQISELAQKEIEQAEVDKNPKKK